MSRPFCYNRRESFYASQDYAPDHRYALMRWSGNDTSVDDLVAKFDRQFKKLYKSRVWDGVRLNFRPDRKRQKKGHRS